MHEISSPRHTYKVLGLIECQCLVEHVYIKGSLCCYSGQPAIHVSCMIVCCTPSVVPSVIVVGTAGNPLLVTLCVRVCVSVCLCGCLCLCVYSHLFVYDV